MRLGKRAGCRLERVSGYLEAASSYLEPPGYSPAASGYLERSGCLEGGVARRDNISSDQD